MSAKPTLSALLVACACVAAYAAEPAPKTDAAPGGPVPPVVIELFKPIEIAQPDHVIGSGTPESVTEDALQKALDKGGSIVFNTGGKPVTLKLTKVLNIPQTAKPVTIDGRGLITFDGDGKTRILQKAWKTELTVERVRFQHARDPKNGAGIWNTHWDGRLTVIDCQFEDCKTTEAGPDIGGGAIRVTGQKNLIVSGCTFNECEGSNGGAICTIGCQMTIVGNSFTNCKAFGKGGGADAGPTGQGGIGGAIYHDGVSQNVDKKQAYVGDCYFKDNYAGDHAGAIFGYTIPKEDSLSIYYNCIFENNTVSSVQDTPGDPGHGGAIYSMYCRLHVINCSFGNNKCPARPGPIFTALMVSEQYANCEFYGNSPEQNVNGENISKTKRDVPPAVAALGRMPGAPQAGAAKTAVKDTASKSAEPKVSATPAAPPPPKVDEKALAAFDTKLRDKLAETLKAGKKVTAFIRIFGEKDTPKEYPIAAVDEKSLQVSVQGNKMPVKWDGLAISDRAQLAKALVDVDSEDAIALLLAGVYFAADGQLDKAEELLAKAGTKDANAVADARKALGMK
ncbi:MAG: right-handed parallel beta-helix repeat-containing protein [Planctomycetes bacterium]|nr:right-handed parallel beta-helix repeat-containing protein [Planctomycetota bacterium]